MIRVICGGSRATRRVSAGSWPSRISLGDAEATDHIRTIAGTSGMSPSYAIERCWRDAHGVASHAGFGVHNLEKVGMVALGMDPPGGI